MLKNTKENQIQVYLSLILFSCFNCDYRQITSCEIFCWAHKCLFVLLFPPLGGDEWRWVIVHFRQVSERCGGSHTPGWVWRRESEASCNNPALCLGAYYPSLNSWLYCVKLCGQPWLRYTFHSTDCWRNAFWSPLCPFPLLSIPSPTVLLPLVFGRTAHAMGWLQEKTGIKTPSFFNYFLL